MLCRTWKCVLTAIFSGVNILEFPGCHLLQKMSSQWGSQQLRLGLLLSKTQQPTFLILILALYATILDDSIDSGNFSVSSYLLLIQKGSVTHVWSCSLYEGRTSLFMGLISRKFLRVFFMFLPGFTSFSFLLLFPG